MLTLVDLYGNNAKNEIIRIVLGDIFTLEEIRIDKMLIDISNKNVAINKKTARHNFIHKGIEYPYNNTKALLLNDVFKPDVELILGQLTQTRKAKRYTEFYLKKVMSLCMTWADVNYLVPPKIKNFIFQTGFSGYMIDTLDRTVTKETKITLDKSAVVYISIIETYLLTKALLKT